MYLNFNYTRVLEELYEQCNVHHIHGETGGDLIFGHGETLRESKHSGATWHLSKIHDYFKKPTEDVISNNWLFYGRLSDIKDVYSFGFSFSNVDLPYIKKICRCWDTSDWTWHLNIYKNTPKKMNDTISRLKSCGFKGNYIEFYVNQEDLC